MLAHIGRRVPRGSGGEQVFFEQQGSRAGECYDTKTYPENLSKAARGRITAAIEAKRDSRNPLKRPRDAWLPKALIAMIKELKAEMRPRKKATQGVAV